LKNPVHWLRKVFGSYVARDHGILVASKMLGHSSTKITEEVYVGVVDAPVANVI
jgi:integrase